MTRRALFAVQMHARIGVWAWAAGTLVGLSLLFLSWWLEYKWQL